MKQFNLKDKEYYLEKRGSEIIFKYRYEKKTLVGSKEIKIEAEALLDWLKEALTPKYVVIEGVDMFHVQLDETGETVTSFHKEMEDLDPKAEAYALCNRLNGID